MTCPAGQPTYLHDDYLRHQLMLVRTGRKTRAPGIRRCPDCKEPHIADQTGIAYCPECRVNHTVRCRTCRAPIPLDGNPQCLCCQNQIPLFHNDVFGDVS